jgi:DNA-binding MarR family transcriptional regulator
MSTAETFDGPDGPQGLLGYQLAMAAISTRGVFTRLVGAPLALRPVEYTVLALIRNHPDISPARLAQALSVSAPNITLWIDKLAQRGLVAREKNRNDKRAQHLRVTPRGEQLTAMATRQLIDGERAEYGNLSSGERAILIELLKKVASARPNHASGASAGL